MCAVEGKAKGRKVKTARKVVVDKMTPKRRAALGRPAGIKARRTQYSKAEKEAMRLSLVGPAVTGEGLLHNVPHPSPGRKVPKTSVKPPLSL